MIQKKAMTRDAALSAASCFFKFDISLTFFFSVNSKRLKEPKTCPHLADWEEANFILITPISLSVLCPILEFGPLQWSKFNRDGRATIWSTATSAPNTWRQRSNIIREAEPIRRPGKVEERPRCLWLEDLNFDMLDQKYGLGEKICPTLVSIDAAIRRSSYSWLQDGDDDDQGDL